MRSPVLVFAAAFSLVIAVSAAVFSYQDHNQVVTVAETRTLDAARVLEEHARRLFDTSDRVLRRIADRVAAQGLDVFRRPPGRAELVELAATLPHDGALTILDGAGMPVASSDTESLPRLSLADRGYWKAHQAGAEVFIGPMIAGRLKDNLVFTVSRALRDEAGAVRAVVIAAIMPSYIDDYMDWLGVPKLYFGLYKEDGEIIMRVPVRAEDVGRSVSRSRIFELYPGVQAGNYHTNSVFDGEDRIAAFVKVRDLPLIAGASLRADEVFEPWKERLRRNLAMAVLAISAIMGLAWHASRTRERKLESERLASDTAQRLSLALNATQAAVCEWDVQSGRCSWSGGFRPLFGMAPEVQPSYAAWQEMIAEPDREAIDRTIAEAAKSRQDTVSLEYRLAGDQRRWVLSLMNLQYRRDGSLARTAGVHLDVTRLKEVEAAKDRALREAEQANAAKSRFLAAASHDLRQPTQSMALLLAALAPMVEGLPAGKVVGLLERSLDGLNTLLVRLLDISRLDAGVIVPAPIEMDLLPLLTRLGEEYRLQAAQKGLELKVLCAEARIHSDPVLVERIVRNLVENALRYTERGGILLGCRRRGGRVAVTVSDTGPGIPPEKQSAIFEEFVQLHNSERDRAQGLGLGLAIVRRLAQLLQAEVALKSRPGRGSAFSVVF